MILTAHNFSSVLKNTFYLHDSRGQQELINWLPLLFNLLNSFSSASAKACMVCILLKKGARLSSLALIDTYGPVLVENKY